MTCAPSLGSSLYAIRTIRLAAEAGSAPWRLLLVDENHETPQGLPPIYSSLA
jgi:hypothetical protein